MRQGKQNLQEAGGLRLARHSFFKSGARLVLSITWNRSSAENGLERSGAPMFAAACRNVSSAKAEIRIILAAGSFCLSASAISLPSSPGMRTSRIKRSYGKDQAFS